MATAQAEALGNPWLARLRVNLREIATLVAIWALATAFAVALPRFSTVAALIENWIGDFRMVWLSARQPRNPDIVILAINEDTLAGFPYRSPIDRGFLADVLARLAQVKVRAVGIDVLFDQPSEPDKDAKLRETLLNYPVPVVTGWGGPAELLTEKQLAFQGAYLQGIRHGYSNLVRDANDGAVRDIFPGRQESDAQGGDRWAPGFIPALAGALGKAVPQAIMPLRMRVSENGGGDAFAMYPIHRAKLLPPAWLAGKVVLIGADLPQQDRHPTAFSIALGPRQGDLPGVTIHAHALAQLLEGSTPAPPRIGVAAGMAAAAAGLGVLIALVQRGTLATVLLGLAGLAALLGSTTLAFTRADVSLPVFAPGVALALSLALSAAAVARRQREQRRFIRDAFARYVSPTVVHRLEEDPAQLTLGGERRRVTYLFSDIAGFTSLSETTAPDLLVGVLNEYLDNMTRIVLGYEGTVDKFIGDAVVAMFGAPLDQPDHAARAIRCALDMDRFARGFEPVAHARGVALGITRIGVHTGEVVVGNFGGEQRFEYTSIGDTVNTASRMEGVNKYIGTRICVSGVAVEAAPGIPVRPIGYLVLKGKNEPIAAYEPLGDPLGDPAAVSAEGRAPDQAYAEAFALMEEGDPQAYSSFVRLAEQAPTDPLVRLHRERLERGERGAQIVMTDK